jgi:hypothetical protein
MENITLFIATNKRYKDARFQVIYYNNTALKFILITDLEYNHMVIYKSNFNLENRYGIQQLIFNLFKEYLVKSNIYKAFNFNFYFHDSKFINLDDILEKVLSKYEIDNDIYHLDLELSSFNFINISLNFININYDCGIKVYSDINKSNYNALDETYNFGNATNLVLKDILKKITDIAGEIKNTNYSNIKSYTDFIFKKYLEYSDDYLITIFNSLAIPLTELKNYNKVFSEIDFENFSIEESEDFKKFRNILNSKLGLSMKYLNYKFENNRLNIHIPLYNNVTSYDKIRRYQSYSDWDSNVENLLYMYFYIYKKNNIFDKFKDAGEKLILK